jgi:hypothetical protein
MKRRRFLMTAGLGAAGASSAFGHALPEMTANPLSFFMGEGGKLLPQSGIPLTMRLLLHRLRPCGQARPL